MPLIRYATNRLFCKKIRAMINIIQKLIFVVSFFFKLFKKYKFSFVNNHSNLTNKKVLQVQKEINLNNNYYREQYEKKFSKIIGPGYSVSFAAARMGLSSLLKECNIVKNKEVIILGFTCSAVPLAIINVGAKPVYSDVNLDNFGSSLKEIKKKINKNTKAIIVQHSFGIPANIECIIEYAKQKKIFVIEDCAITLGSKIKNKKVGNFGDAAIFSTDHSKPINTLMGGIVYTKNYFLYKKLKKIEKDLPELSNKKKLSIFKQILLERKHINSYLIINLFYKFFILRHFSYPFLDKNIYNKPKVGCFDLLRMPTFLCVLGIHEIQKWKIRQNKQKRLFLRFIKFMKKNNLIHHLPKAYFNTNLKIIPSRIAWYEANGRLLRRELQNIFNIQWTWFLKPVDNTPLPQKFFFYKSGSCKISEKVGKNIINLPMNIKNEKMLFEKIRKFYA
jgi:perosamine synthetase